MFPCLVRQATAVRKYLKVIKVYYCIVYIMTVVVSYTICLSCFMHRADD